MRSARMTRLEAADVERVAEDELLAMLANHGDKALCETGFTVDVGSDRVLIRVGETKKKIKTKKVASLDD